MKQQKEKCVSVRLIALSDKLKFRYFTFLDNTNEYGHKRGPEFESCEGDLVDK